MCRLCPPSHTAKDMREIKIIPPKIQPLPPTLRRLRQIVLYQTLRISPERSKIHTAVCCSFEMLLYPPPTLPPRIMNTRITLQLRICKRKQSKRRFLPSHPTRSINKTCGLCGFGFRECALLKDRVEVEVDGSEDCGREEEAEDVQEEGGEAHR